MSSEKIHQTCLAKTSLGTEIQLYKKVHKQTRPYLFIGGVHGDEPEGVTLALAFLEWLKNHNASEKFIHDWALIPCLNPDGFQRHERTNSRGVDLNRNFPVRDWSSEHKAPRYFPGSAPNSENETQALVKLIDGLNPELIVHFHSWEPCVVYTGLKGKPYAELIGRHLPYEVREDIGYPTPGSLGQYGWLERNIPVICIEEQEKIALNTIWPRFERGLIDLITTSIGDKA